MTPVPDNFRKGLNRSKAVPGVPDYFQLHDLNFNSSIKPAVMVSDIDTTRQTILSKIASYNVGGWTPSDNAAAQIASHVCFCSGTPERRRSSRDRASGSPGTRTGVPGVVGREAFT